jgi:hypothetical protein
MQLVLGLILLALAATLIFFGLPDKHGNSPRFLQFGAALVLYPPTVLVVLALGVAELFFQG